MKKIGTKILSRRGIVLDNEQLENYMEKMAINYSIKNESSIETYPIIRMKDNYKFIEKTYNMLTAHIKQGIDIYPAGEWLLDNFYIIEESIKRISKELSIKKYINLPGISEGMYKGFARIYVIAEEIVSYSDCRIEDNLLELAIMGYQKRKSLSMEEIWNLNLFLQIALIENIRGVSEKIYLAEVQKYKVENIVERLVEKKDTESQKFKIRKEDKKFEVSYKEMKFPFIEYMSYKLKKYGKHGIQYLNILEEQVNKMGMSVSEAIKKEHSDIAMQKVLIGNSITSIREISRINFSKIFEEINGVENILKQDPANVYINMDFQTKEYYRNTIKELSKKTKIAENYIGRVALELAEAGYAESAHIGYYLIGEGYNLLLEKLNINKGKCIPKEVKIKAYIYSIYWITFLISAILGFFLFKRTKNALLPIVFTILSIIPVSEIYIQTLNYILIKIVKPKPVPKMDVLGNIPKKFSTMVIIPTIINSKEKVIELMKKMEVYYLANKSKNIYFTLLGDCTSSKNKEESFDKDIIEKGLAEVERLNKKYQTEEKIFNFMYRNRTWNEKENTYLGWERKRGLITEFNEFLINGKNNFRINTMEKPINIKYVITLDSDTNLILNSAFKLIGAMAHILNTPVIDERKNVVIQGHALIQPRVGIDIEASRKSLFTKIFGGPGGTDIYTNAISDIYQDNFDEGIFTGKGIYNLEVFNKILTHEIPENTVLSHDLLEGSYLRCGLSQDIMLMDGYPAKINSYLTRMVRWVRGDWQLLRMA